MRKGNSNTYENCVHDGFPRRILHSRVINYRIWKITWKIFNRKIGFGQAKVNTRAILLLTSTRILVLARHSSFEISDPLGIKKKQRDRALLRKKKRFHESFLFRSKMNLC